MNTTTQRNTVWVVGVLVLLAAVVALYLSAKPATPSTTSGGVPVTTGQPQLSADLYPLYTAAVWGAPKAATFELPTASVTGVSVSGAAATNTMDPGSIFTPFESYYAVKLAALGWKVDNSLAAGGPVGGQTAYRKATSLILINYHTVFHTLSPTTPAQCPCDITFTLFSKK